MKTVDYDRATQDAGGLGKALASMGGSVYEPGAYARGGYAPGGLVDSNDLSALIASQREAFGPFSQGGPYGQSAQQAPFSGAGGVVPQNRLPSPKLVTAGAPPRQQEGGLKQAMSDISQGGKFAEKAGTLLDKFSPKEGAEEGVESFGKQLAGFGKSLSEMTSFAHGGGIRPHYAAGGGGINPYDQNKSPMDYFPEEVLEEGDPGKKELPKPGQLPSSGGGGGLGSALSTASSLASLGSTAMKAAPMIAEGASALMALLPFSDSRLKHDIEPIGKTYDGQNIYRYHMGDGVTRMGLMAQEVADRRPDAVGRGPGGFLTLDYDKATGESVPYEGGIRPREGFQEGGPAEEGFDIIKRYWPNVERTESGGKQFDPKTGQPLTSSAGAIGVAQVMPKTAPEAARLAGVEFDEQRYRNDPDYNRALGQAYLREQYRTFGDPALALAAYNAGPGNVRAALARAEKEGGSYKQYLPSETQDYLVKTGAVPRDAIARAAGVRPSDDFLGGPPVRFGTKSIQRPKGEQFESWKDFLTSRQFLQPLAIGLGTMASSPSRYLGAAVLQGLGGGAQAYSNLEKQMADIAQTQQQTAESKAREVTGLSGVPLSALIGELGPDGKVTYRVRPDYFGGTVAGAGVKPPGTPGAPETGQPALPGGGLAGAQKTAIEAGKEAVESPIKVDTTATRYNFSVAPQAATDEQFRQFGFTGDPSRDAYVVPSTMGAQPNVAAQAAADQTAAQKIVDAEAPGVEQRRSDANLLVDSVFGITEKGVAGLGPKQRERASALALYDWAVKFAGLPGLSSDERQNISAAQIIEKVRQEMGSRTAESLGFHGQALAQALNEAQITGSLDPVAASKLAASLYVNTQRPQDFARYYNSYVRKYGTALNVRENFNREMAQRYDREKTALQHALMPTYVNGKPENAVMALRAGKVSPQEFDAYYKTPGLARLIMGG
jgi:hypothetical protein